MYIERIAHLALQRFMRSFPVVGLTGPRQSGKSTFLCRVLPDYQYVNFDEINNVAFFEDDPEGFIKQYHQKVIFDEVQFVPKLFNAIKVAVDKDRNHYGRFILTGSSQFSFLQKASESLAGRIGLMTLLPFQYAEMPKSTVSEAIYRGCYPELVLRAYRDADLWYASYLETYLTKDIRALMQIGNMRDFHRLIRLLAANVAQILDMSHFSNEIGVSVPTIKRWLSVLEASYIIFLLPPYFTNLGKRIVKRPKIYFYDTGLVSFLTGIKTFDLYDKGLMAGSLFENYVISEIIKKEKHTANSTEFYFLRTQDKVEIDMIVDYKTHADFIEIKKTSTCHARMYTALKKYPKQRDRKIILYNGDSLKRGDILIMPYDEYLLDGPVGG